MTNQLTYLLTYLLTWVGAGDTCVSKNSFRFSIECIDIGSVTGRLEVLSRLAKAKAGADRVI